jgi:Cu/Ag efflux pump CusA
MIDSYDGKNVPLYYVADIESSSGPNTISRENVHRKLVVSINVADRDVGSVVKDIQGKINEHISLPENYHLEYGGQFRSAERATKRLAWTSIAAILIVFLILFQEFHSGRLAGIVLLNLPLALIGGVIAIWITSGDMSIPAIIGFITLFGIATRNGILLVSRYNNLRTKNVGLYDSVIRGSLDRLNPILMTALTAALALIPLALAGNQAGNEIQSPMAVVILGGLLTSTFLNIFVIPVVYYLIHQKNEKNEN